MEELVEILIRLIASLFENKAAKPQRPGGTPSRPGVMPTRPLPTVQPPPLIKKLAPRRGGRRPAPTTIAVAEPIITKVSDAKSAPVQVARTIVANTGIAKPNETPSQSAAAVRKWLTPDTLKHQFLLTEILQPPLALRDKH
jgi:hypothetical protein